MSVLSKHTYRIAADYGNVGDQWIDYETNNLFQFPSGVDLKIQFGVRESKPPAVEMFYDLSDVASMKLEIKPLKNGRSAPDADDAAYMPQTVVTLDATTVAINDWQAGTAQHVTFDYTDTDTALPIDTYWMVLSGVLTGGDVVSFGWAQMKVIQDGTGIESESTLSPTLYYNRTETNALLAGKQTAIDAVQTDVDANEVVTDAQIASAQTAINMRKGAAKGVAHLTAKLKECASGDRNRLMVLHLGDSLGFRLSRYLDGFHLSSWFLDSKNAIHYPTNPADGTGDKGMGGVNLDTNTTGDDLERDDYNLSWCGSHVDISAGEYVHFTRTFTSAFTSRVVMPYVTSSGAGSFKIRITADAAATPVGQQNNVLWEDINAGDIASGHTLTGSELIVDCDGSDGLGVVVLEFSAFRNIATQCMHEAGGIVQLLHPMFEVNEVPAVNYYDLLEGGNSFESGITATTNARMGSLIAELKPDLITIQCDDSADAAESIMDGINEALTGASLGYDPLVIAIGNGPSSGKDAEMVAQNEMFANKAAQYNYGFFSLLDLLPDYAAAAAVGWGGDGVHLNDEFYVEGALQVARKFGFDSTAGLAYDPSGYKKYLNTPALALDMRDAPFASTGLVGSAAFTEDIPYWEFTTGTTASSTLTRYLNDFGGPYQFRSSSYQLVFDNPESIDFALKLDLANAEGQFWMHYGTSSYNTDAAADQSSSKCISFKLENATPVLQVCDGTTFTEASGSAIDHNTSGTAASEIWLTYRIVNTGTGKVFLMQNGQLVAQTDSGPVGSVNTAGFRLSIANGVTAAGYSIYITPPIVKPLSK